MTILVIEHHDKPSLGIVGQTLGELGVQTHIVWATQGEPIPESPSNYRGLILLGGAMNVLDDDNYPYYGPLMRLIRQFKENDTPILGICHGAQMIARTFGADVSLDGPFEFGFHEITPTDHGHNDPVLGHLQSPHHLFQWHTDHYSLPAGAVHLATGSQYPHQSYRIGRATYATQFHFEIDKALVESWIDTYMDFSYTAPGYEEWLPRQFENYLGDSMKFCTEFTRRWVDLTV